MALKHNYKRILLCVCTGAALAVSFPKTNLIFFAWAAFIPLFYVLAGTERPVYSFLYAFLAGSVFNLQANFWLIDTVNLFADNYPASIIFYIFFCS
jgi:apolipoprotein N-acyltransferase